MKGQVRIDEMYAFIALDPADNTEGVTAFMNPATGGWMPMVGADMERVESLKEQARLIAQQSGVTITLCRFSVREELEVIEP